MTKAVIKHEYDDRKFKDVYTLSVSCKVEVSRLYNAEDHQAEEFAADSLVGQITRLINSYDGYEIVEKESAPIELYYKERVIEMLQWYVQRYGPIDPSEFQ